MQHFLITAACEQRESYGEFIYIPSYKDVALPIRNLVYKQLTNQEPP